MADFELSAGRTSDPPTLPLAAGDLIMISQFRGGAWATAVITIGELMAHVAASIELDANRITTGTLPIAHGGTGATTDDGARANLHAASTEGANTFIGQQNFSGQIVADGGIEIPVSS